MKIQFDTYSISVSAKEIDILHRLNTESTTVDQFTMDDWTTIDLLWRKHIVIYDKSREKKPEIQPWCKSTVLRSLSKEQSGA